MKKLFTIIAILISASAYCQTIDTVIITATDTTIIQFIPIDTLAYQQKYLSDLSDSIFLVGRMNDTHHSLCGRRRILRQAGATIPKQ